MNAEIRIDSEQWDGLWRTKTGRQIDRWGWRAVQRVREGGRNVTTMCEHLHRSRSGADDCAAKLLAEAKATGATIDAPDHLWFRVGAA